MMKSILLLIIIFYFSVVVQTQEFNLTLLSPSTSLTNSIIKYQVSSTECKFQDIYILVEKLITTDGINLTNSVIVSENSKSTIFKSNDYNLNIGIISTIKFDVNGDENKGTISIGLECREMNVSNINVEIIEEVFWCTTQKYSSIVRLNGLNDDVGIPKNSFGINFIIQSLGNQLYKIIYKNDYLTLKLDSFSEWITEITFPNNQKLIIAVPFNTTKSINNNIENEEIIGFKKFPNTSEIELNDTVFGKLITFISTSSLQRPIYLLRFGFYFSPIPISGYKGNIKYISYSVPLLVEQDLILYKQLNDGSFSGFPVDYKLLYSLNEGYTLEKNLNITIAYDYGDDNNMPFFTATLNPTGLYCYRMNSYHFKSSELSYAFSFGLSGNNNNSQISVSIPLMPTNKTQLYFTVTNNAVGPAVNITPSSNPKVQSIPVMNLFEKVYLSEFKFLLRFNLTDENGIKNIRIQVGDRVNFYNTKNLVKGTIYNGIWEGLYDAIYDEDSNANIRIENFVDESIIFEKNVPYSIENPLSLFSLPKMELNSDQSNYRNNLKDVSFLYNNVYITNHTFDNIISFTFNNIDVYKNMTIGFSLSDPKSLKEAKFTLDYLTSYNNPNYYFAKWNDSISKFSCKFTIPANTIPGVLDYTLSFTKYNSIESVSLEEKYQLNVVSENVDIYGPIVTNITNNPFSNSSLGWLFTIEDEINGFSHGYILIRGDIDGSLYNISITTNNIYDGVYNGDKWKADYLFIIPLVIEDCIPQDFEITYVTFTDTQGNENKYYKFITEVEKNDPYISIDSTINPFINYIGSLYSVLHISVNSTICTNKLDVTPPVLVNFTSSKASMDVGQIDRIIEFTFTAKEIESNIKEDQLPTVYLISETLDSVYCISSIVLKNDKNITYFCSVEVPLGFGFPGGFLLSVSGFINTGGHYKSYNSKELKDLSQSWFVSVNTQYSMVPIITSSNKIGNLGDDDLWLYGRCFSLIDSFKIYYSDSSTEINTISTTIYESAVLIKGIKATYQNFIINLFSLQNNVVSNNYTVTPTIFDFTEPNAPQECIGDPICGGKDQGNCQYTGCVCVSPWIGIDCSSKLVNSKPPNINITEPTVEITIPGGTGSTTSSSSSSNEIIFKTLISIASLREISFNGEVVKTIKIDKWVYTEINSTVSKYNATLSIKDQTFNIITIVSWFNKSSIVYFANQALQMNPSSVKFNIDISKYPFQSSLNNLQLIMSASITSLPPFDNDIICSSIQFGNTSSGDNSNFIKLQVSDHSVYGRFIKRAIIDGKIINVENKLLNETQTSTPTFSQGFIAITIPHFKSLASIDPDFSVLVDNYKVTIDSKNNPICNHFGNDDDKGNTLSTAKIVGIAVTCFVVISAIVISIVYAIYKKKEKEKMFSKMRTRLDTFNSTAASSATNPTKITP